MNAEKGNAPAVAAAEASIDKQIQSTKGNVQMNNTTIVSNHALTVPFHGAELYVIPHNDEPYTPLKPIVTGMNLTWHGQFLKLKSNANRWGILELRIPTKSGVQSMLCMPLRKLPAWLCSIEVGKIKNPDTREVVIAYQNECDDALWDYWNKGYAINPRPFSMGCDDVLTVEEADELRDLMKGWAVKLSPDTRVQGQFLQQGWSKLKAHFKASYRQIPRFELPEALSIIMRHVNEWEAKVSTMPAHSVSDLILQGMDSLRAFVSVDMRTGERQIVALRDTERIVDLGSEDRIRALVHDLDHSYYPTILKTIQQHYLEVEQAYYSRQRRANDMPVSALPA